MGSSNAYLFGRFTDTTEILGKAHELLAKGTPWKRAFAAVALVGSHNGLKGFLDLPGEPLSADFDLPPELADDAERLFPGTDVHHREGRGPWVLGRLDEAMVAALARIEPVTVGVDTGDREYGELEKAFAAAVGEHWADLSWWCSWPECGSYCGVGVTLNGSGYFEQYRRDGHELYWHVSSREQERDVLAARYAAEVGLTAEFPPLHGW